MRAFNLFLTKKYGGIEHRWSYQYNSDDTSHSDEIYIWISPPRNITSEMVEHELRRGVKLVVFDTSDVSLTWLRAIGRQRLNRYGSMNDVYAGHINGNKDLPVLFVGKDENSWLRLTAGVGWMIAFNHPMPLEEEGLPLYILKHSAFGTPFFVVRDESWPITLMMNTFNNKDLMDAMLDSLCKSDCHVVLYEPSFGLASKVSASVLSSQASGGKDGVSNDLSRNASLSNERISVKKKVEKTINEFDISQTVFRYFPWLELLGSIMAIILFLMVVLVFPLKRGKG